MTAAPPSLTGSTGIRSPAEEVILAALVLVPDGDLELLADPREEVEVELLQPPRVQRLVDGLRLVAVIAQPESTIVLSRSKTDTGSKA